MSKIRIGIIGSGGTGRVMQRDSLKWKPSRLQQSRQETLKQGLR